MSNYEPKPIDTSKVVLPVEIEDLTEKLAENTHDTWAEMRMKEGWTYGESRDDTRKTHPCLVPYSDLPEQEKEYDRRTAIDTLRAIYAMGYHVEKGKGAGQKMFFLSYSTRDTEKADALRFEMEAANLKTWYAPVDIFESGEWKTQIQNALAQTDVFVLLLSRDSLDSEYVLQEIEWVNTKYRNRIGKIIPVLIDDSVRDTWSQERPELSSFQLFDLSGKDYDVNFHRLMNAFGVKYTPKCLTYGDLKLPIWIYVGGDGETRYGKNDIITQIDEHFYELPDCIRPFAAELIEKKKEENRIKGRKFDNGDQVRFKRATWGTAETRDDPGSENLPLRMELEWTKYYVTHLTNFNTDFILDPTTKETVEDRLWTDISDQGIPSLYSDPFTTNLSVITSDGYIFLKTRGSTCAGNPGDLNKFGSYSIQPAVSGSGSRADIDSNGYYDPFETAIREAREEILGKSGIVPDSDISITFFGLARIWRTRFPFLFGELRLKNTTSDVIKSIKTQTSWEGDPIAIEFTVEKVTDWIRSNYFEFPDSGKATTYFSLIQSLIYAYPDRIPEINRRLSLSKDVPTTNESQFNLFKFLKSFFCGK